MGSRPAQIRYLKEGKSLGAAVHKGWVATWNWLLAWVNSFKGGMGCKLKNASSGHPILDVLIEGGDGVDVRCGGDGQPYVISATGGGGGSGSPAGTSETVVTGIEFDWVTDSSGFEMLVAKVTTKSVTVLTSGGATTTNVGVGLWKQNVVIGSRYNTSTHKFTNKHIAGVRTVGGSVQMDNHVGDGDVFEATAHSAE